MIAELILPTGEVLINVPSHLYTLVELGFSPAQAQRLLETESQKNQTLDILNNRKAAYMYESDPLYMEWQFDQTAEAEQVWRDKVAEIKARYPLPSNG